MERVDKTNYYLDIAETISERGTCLRNNYGSVIVKNDEIISTGYTGAPRGRKNCLDLGYCTRKQKTELSGAGFELCRSVHSEQNAIISANRRDMIGATLYLVGINKRNGEYITDFSPRTISVCWTNNSDVYFTKYQRFGNIALSNIIDMKIITL